MIRERVGAVPRRQQEEELWKVRSPMVRFQIDGLRI